MTSIRLLVFAAALSLSACSTAKDPFDAIPDKQGDVQVEKVPTEDSSIAVEKAETKWEISPDMSLRQTLIQWTKQASWNSVSWEIPGGRDYAFTQSGTITGTFEDAIKKLSLYMLNNTDFKIQCVPHTGNKVLQVTLMEGKK